MASRRPNATIPAKLGGPTLKPEEASQRAARIAVDMCVMNTQYMITLSEFMSLGEIFHLQMHLLYGLVDTMAATSNTTPETVLDFARNYFRVLREERHEINHAPNQ